MTYFEVLGVFVVLPTLVLVALVPRDVWRWLLKREGRVNWEPYLVVLFHVVLALVYTTPWDNYLVANRVWWYDPELVTGITLGWRYEVYCQSTDRGDRQVLVGYGEYS